MNSFYQSHNMCEHSKISDTLSEWNYTLYNVALVKLEKYIHRTLFHLLLTHGYIKWIFFRVLFEKSRDGSCMFITYWLKMHFIFSPAKVTLLGSVIFTFQHAKHLAVSRHNLMFLYTMFLVATKVRIQSSYKSILQMLYNQNSAY